MGSKVVNEDANRARMGPGQWPKKKPGEAMNTDRQIIGAAIVGSGQYCVHALSQPRRLALSRRGEALQHRPLLQGIVPLGGGLLKQAAGLLAVWTP